MLRLRPGGAVLAVVFFLAIFLSTASSVEDSSQQVPALRVCVAFNEASLEVEAVEADERAWRESSTVLSLERLVRSLSAAGHRVQLLYVASSSRKAAALPLLGAASLAGVEFTSIAASATTRIASAAAADESYALLEHLERALPPFDAAFVAATGGLAYQPALARRQHAGLSGCPIIAFITGASHFDWIGDADDLGDGRDAADRGVAWADGVVAATREAASVFSHVPASRAFLSESEAAVLELLASLRAVETLREAAGGDGSLDHLVTVVILPGAYGNSDAIRRVGFGWAEASPSAELLVLGAPQEEEKWGVADLKQRGWRHISHPFFSAAAALNHAVKHSRGRFLLLPDARTVPRKGGLTQLARAALRTGSRAVSGLTAASGAVAAPGGPRSARMLPYDVLLDRSAISSTGGFAEVGAASEREACANAIADMVQRLAGSPGIEVVPVVTADLSSSALPSWFSPGVIGEHAWDALQHALSGSRTPPPAGRRRRILQVLSSENALYKLFTPTQVVPLVNESSSVALQSFGGFSFQQINGSLQLSDLTVTINSTGKGVLALNVSAINATNLSGVNPKSVSGSTITFTAPASNVSAAISAVTYTGSSNQFGSETVVIRVSQSGGANAVSLSLAFTIYAVNGAPNLTIPVAFNTSQNTPVFLPAFSFDDPDAGDGLLTTEQFQLNITATYGTIRIATVASNSSSNSSATASASNNISSNNATSCNSTLTNCTSTNSTSAGSNTTSTTGSSTASSGSSVNSGFVLSGTCAGLQYVQEPPQSVRSLVLRGSLATLRACARAGNTIEYVPKAQFRSDLQGADIVSIQVEDLGSTGASRNYIGNGDATGPGATWAQMYPWEIRRLSWSILPAGSGRSAPLNTSRAFVASGKGASRSQTVDLYARVGTPPSVLEARPVLRVGEYVACTVREDTFYFRAEVRDGANNTIMFWDSRQSNSSSLGFTSTGPNCSNWNFVGAAFDLKQNSSAARYVYIEDGGTDGENWVGDFGPRFTDAFIWLSQEARGTVNVTVSHVNQPPTAVDAAAITDAGSSLAFNLSCSDPDVEDQPSTKLTYSVAGLAFASASNVTNFTATALGNLTAPVAGSITATYTPSATGFAVVGFNFTCADAGLLSSTGRVSIDVNDKPVVVTGNWTATPENVPVTIWLNFTDAYIEQGRSYSVSVTSLPANGTLQQFPGGANAKNFTNVTEISLVDRTSWIIIGRTYAARVIYIPAPDMNGLFSFTFTVSDGRLSTSGVANINVTEVLQPPRTRPTSWDTWENQTCNVTLSLNTWTPENEPILYNITRLPLNGAVYQWNPITQQRGELISTVPRAVTNGTVQYDPSRNQRNFDGFSTNYGLGFDNFAFVAIGSRTLKVSENTTVTINVRPKFLNESQGNLRAAVPNVADGFNWRHLAHNGLDLTNKTQAIGAQNENKPFSSIDMTNITDVAIGTIVYDSVDDDYKAAMNLPLRAGLDNPFGASFEQGDITYERLHTPAERVVALTWDGIPSDLQGGLKDAGFRIFNASSGSTSLLNKTRTARFSSLKMHGRGTVPGSHSGISRALNELIGVMSDDSDTTLWLVSVSTIDGLITRLCNLQATSAFLNGAAYNSFDGYYYVLVEDDSMRASNSSGNGRLLTIDLSKFTSTMAKAGSRAPIVGNVTMQQRVHNLKYAFGVRKLLGLVAPQSDADSFQLAVVDNSTGLAVPIARLPAGAAASFAYASLDANNSVYYATFDQMKSLDASGLGIMAIDVRLNATLETGTINDRIAYLQSDLELCCLNTIPRKSYAWGPGLDNARSNYRTHFWIQARDMYYRNITFGNETITIFMNNSLWLNSSATDAWNRNKTASNTTMEAGNIRITDLLNGTYHVEYTPDTDGIYVLSIKINHEHIVGSPRNVTIRGWTRGAGPNLVYNHWHVRTVDVGQSPVTGRPVSYRVAFYSAFFDKNLFVNETWPVIKGFNDTTEMYKTMDPVRRYTAASIWMQTSSQLECRLPGTNFQYNIKSEHEQAVFRCSISKINVTDNTSPPACPSNGAYDRSQNGPPRAPAYLIPLPPADDPVAAFQYIVGAPKDVLPAGRPLQSRYISSKLDPKKYLAALVLSCSGCEATPNVTEPSTGLPSSYQASTIFFPEEIAGNCQMRWDRDYWTFITDEYNHHIALPMVWNITTQHSPVCDATELAALKSEMDDIIERYALATTPQQLRQLEMLFSTLKSRTVYIACKDMLDRFSLYGANATKPVPATTACNETFGSLAWGVDPCCNTSRMPAQCCRPREVLLPVNSLADLVGSQLNTTSNATLAGREAIQAHADNVSAADPAMGCSAATRRALGGDSVMVFNERLRVYNTCVDAVFGRKLCSYGGQCYSGRCTAPSGGVGTCVPPVVYTNSSGYVSTPVVTSFVRNRTALNQTIVNGVPTNVTIVVGQEIVNVTSFQLTLLNSTFDFGSAEYAVQKCIAEAADEEMYIEVKAALGLGRNASDVEVARAILSRTNDSECTGPASDGFRLRPTYVRDGDGDLVVSNTSLFDLNPASFGNISAILNGSAANLTATDLRNQMCRSASGCNVLGIPGACSGSVCAECLPQGTCNYYGATCPGSVDCSIPGVSPIESCNNVTACDANPSLTSCQSSGFCVPASIDLFASTTGLCASPFSYSPELIPYCGATVYSDLNVNNGSLAARVGCRTSASGAGQCSSPSTWFSASTLTNTYGRGGVATQAQCQALGFICRQQYGSSYFMPANTTATFQACVDCNGTVQAAYKWVPSQPQAGVLHSLTTVTAAASTNANGSVISYPKLYEIIRLAAARATQRRLKNDALCRMNPKMTTFRKIACAKGASSSSCFPVPADTANYTTPIAVGRVYARIPLVVASAGVTLEVGADVVPPGVEFLDVQLGQVPASPQLNSNVSASYGMGAYTDYDESSYTAYRLQDYLDYNITLHPQLEPLRRTPYPVYEQGQRTGEVVGDGVSLTLAGNVSANVRLCIARRPDINRLSSTLVSTLKGPIVGDPPSKFLDLGATDTRMGFLDRRYEVPDFAMAGPDGRPSRPMILATIEHFPDKICGWVNTSATYYPIMRNPWRFNATAYGDNKYLATAGVNATFFLQSRDYFLRNRTVGGKEGAAYNCTLKLQGTPPNARDATLERYAWELELTLGNGITDLGNGTYRVDYNTRVAGIYTASCYVHYKDAWYHVVESPWNTYVQAAPTTALTTNSSGPALVVFVDYTTPAQERVRAAGRVDCVTVNVTTNTTVGNATAFNVTQQQQCTVFRPLYAFYQESGGVPGTVVAGTTGFFHTQARDEFGNFQDHGRDVLDFTVDKGPTLDFTNWNIRRAKFTVPKDFTSPFSKTQYSTTTFAGTPRYDLSVLVNPRVTFNLQQPLLRPNVTVIDASPGFGRWNMTFNATVSGLYTVTLRINGQPVMQNGTVMRSPYNITVLPAEPHAPTTFAEEEGTVFAIAGANGPFIIYGQDKYRNLPMRGDASFTVSLYGPSKNVSRQRGSVNGSCSERSPLPGVFDCRYNATVTGNYTMNLRLWDGDHIRASPFSVWIYPNETDGYQTTLQVPEPLVQKLDAGTTISFSARARDAFDNYQNNSRDLGRIVIVQANASGCCAESLATVRLLDSCYQHLPTRCPYSIRPSGNYSRPTSDYVPTYIATNAVSEEGVDGGLYRITFTPTVAGVYKIYTALNGRNASSGPLTTIVYPKQADTDVDLTKSQGWGSVLDRRSGDLAFVASSWRFYVNISDMYWNIRPINTADPASTTGLTATMYGINDANKVNREGNPVKYEYDWEAAYYNIYFYEETRGTYLVDVKLKGTSLVGSPYTVIVRPLRTNARVTTIINPADAPRAETAGAKAPASYLVAGRTETIAVIPRDVLLNPTTNTTDEDSLSIDEKDPRADPAVTEGVSFDFEIEMHERGQLDVSKKRWRWTRAQLWDVPQLGSLGGNQRVYNLSYTVEDAGDYDLHVFMIVKILPNVAPSRIRICIESPGVNNCSLKAKRGYSQPENNPFPIKVIPDFPDGAQSQLLLPLPSRTVAGDGFSFSLIARDIYGNLIPWGDYVPENVPPQILDYKNATIPRLYTTNPSGDPTSFWGSARRDLPDFRGQDVIAAAAVTDWLNGTYSMIINATRSGMYTVTVGRGPSFQGGKTAQNSGFRIKVFPGPMDARGTFMAGDGDPEKTDGNGLTTGCNAQRLGIRDEAFFTIYGRDRFGNPVESTTEAPNLSMRIVFNNTLCPSTTACTGNNTLCPASPCVITNITAGAVAGTYVATYIPRVKGYYNLTTFYNGTAILPGSVRVCVQSQAAPSVQRAKMNDYAFNVTIFFSNDTDMAVGVTKGKLVFDCNLVLDQSTVATMGTGAQCSWITRRALDIAVGGQATYLPRIKTPEDFVPGTIFLLKEDVIYGNYKSSEAAAGSVEADVPDNPPAIVVSIGAPRTIGDCAGAPLTSFANPQAALSRAWSSIVWTLDEYQNVKNISSGTLDAASRKLKTLFADRSAVSAIDFEVPAELILVDTRYTVSVTYKNFLGNFTKATAVMTKTDQQLPQVRIMDPLQTVLRTEAVVIKGEVNVTLCPTNGTNTKRIRFEWALKSASFFNGEKMLVADYGNATAAAAPHLAPLFALLQDRTGALSSSLFIRAGILGPGVTYTFRLRVVRTDNENLFAEAFSTITVRTTELEVRIAGGDKSVSAAQAFVMEAVPLDNDDADPQSYDGTSFTWSCRTLRYVLDPNLLLVDNSSTALVPVVAENVCRNRDGNPAPLFIRMGNLPLLFPADYFLPNKPNEVFEFNVVMMKENPTWRLSGRKPASATARVTVLAGRPPLVRIRIESPIRSNVTGIIRAADDLTLLAFLEQSVGPATYAWNCTVNGVPVDLPAIALNGRTTGPYLTILGNGLSRGFTYRFRVVVTDDNLTPGFSEKEIVINVPPRFCNMTASPDKGEELKSSFVFNVDKCVTRSKLRYRFRANYDPTNPASSPQTLGLGEDSAILPFKVNSLEHGRTQVGGRYPVEISAVVIDDMEDEAYFSVQISVAPATVDIGVVTSFTAQISAVQIGSSDPATIVQMISVIMNVLNDALSAGTSSSGGGNGGGNNGNGNGNLGTSEQRESIRQGVMTTLETAISAIVGGGIGLTSSFVERQTSVVASVVNKTEEVTPKTAISGINIVTALISVSSVSISPAAGTSTLTAVSALFQATYVTSTPTAITQAQTGVVAPSWVEEGQKKLGLVVSVVTSKLVNALAPDGPPITITTLTISIVATRQSADTFIEKPPTLVAKPADASKPPTTGQLPTGGFTKNNQKNSLRTPNGRVLLSVQPLPDGVTGIAASLADVERAARRRRALDGEAAAAEDYWWLPPDLALPPGVPVVEPLEVAAEPGSGGRITTRSVARRATVPQVACAPREVDPQATFSNEFVEYKLDPHGWSKRNQNYSVDSVVAGLTLRYRASGASETAAVIVTEPTTCGGSYKFSFACSASPALNYTPSCEFFNPSMEVYRPEGVVLLNVSDGVCTCAATHLTDFAVLLREYAPQYSTRTPFENPRLVLDAFYQGNTYAPWIVGSIYLLYLFFAFVGYRWDRKQRLRWKLRLLHGPDAELLDPDDATAAKALARAHAQKAGEPGAAPAAPTEKSIWRFFGRGGLAKPPAPANKATRHLTPAERWEMVKSNRQLAALFLTHRQRMRLLLADPTLANATPLQRWYQAWKYELAERHILLGIFLVHPTDAFTRPRRLTVLLCALMGCLALSAIWFGSRWPSHGALAPEKYPTPAVGVWVSLCLAPVYYALAFLFRRVHPRIARRVGPVPPDLTAEAFVAAPRRVKPLPAHPGVLLTRSRHAAEALAPPPRIPAAAPPPLSRLRARVAVQVSRAAARPVAFDAGRVPAAVNEAVVRVQAAWRASRVWAARRARALHAFQAEWPLQPDGVKHRPYIPAPAPVPRPKPSGAARVGPRPPPLPEGLVVRRAQAARASREGPASGGRQSPEPSDPKPRGAGMPGALDAGFASDDHGLGAPSPAADAGFNLPRRGPVPPPLQPGVPVRRARSIAQPGSQRGAAPPAMAPLRRARRARSSQSSERLDEAAGRMQAAWRGFVTRQALLGRRISIITPNEARAKWKLPASRKALEPAKAAVRIQAAWRGYLFRFHNEAVGAKTLLVVAQARRLRERAVAEELESVRAVEAQERTVANAQLRGGESPSASPRQRAPAGPAPAAGQPGSASRRAGSAGVARRRPPGGFENEAVILDAAPHAPAAGETEFGGEWAERRDGRVRTVTDPRLGRVLLFEGTAQSLVRGALRSAVLPPYVPPPPPPPPEPVAPVAEQRAAEGTEAAPPEPVAAPPPKVPAAPKRPGVSMARARPGRAPWFFAYLAYLLAFGAALIFGYCAIVYGVSLPKGPTNDAWLESAAIALAQELLVIEPVVCALLAAYETAFMPAALHITSLITDLRHSLALGD